MLNAEPGTVPQVVLRGTLTAHPVSVVQAARPPNSEPLAARLRRRASGLLDQYHLHRCRMTMETHAAASRDTDSQSDAVDRGPRIDDLVTRPFVWGPLLRCPLVALDGRCEQ